MRVPAENALSFALFCVTERAVCYLGGQPKPSGIETVQVAGEAFFPQIKLLQIEIEELADLAQQKIVDHETVKLVAMDRQMALAGVFPDILLIHRHTHQVRHNLGESVIVIAFHPDNFNSVPRIRQLANVAQEFPVLFRQAAEVEVVENVTQQDQTFCLDGLQEMQCIMGPADIGPEVQIRNNHGIKAVCLHVLTF